MAEHDLTPQLARHLDRHLVLPLLEFLQERGLYPEEEVLGAKLRLVAGTNMVDYAMAIHTSLHETDDEVPEDMVKRRAEVVARYVALQEHPSPLVAFLRDPQLVQLLRPDKQYNARMLQEHFQIGPDQIEALYDNAKFQFECGCYSDAVAYLNQYRVLSTNGQRTARALWGMLASEILNRNWDAALEELHRLKENIDSKNSSSPLNQLQDSIWLMHWSLFIFFHHENGRNGIIDLFFQDRYLNAIQTNAHHLLRYLAIAVVVNKRRRNMLKELIKVIQHEQYCYKDPITDFLECFILAEKLNMSGDEAELWIVNKVRSSKLDASIDSVSRTLNMAVNRVDVHDHIIESLKNLNMRTYIIAKNIVEPAQAALQAARGD